MKNEKFNKGRVVLYKIFITLFMIFSVITFLYMFFCPKSLYNKELENFLIFLTCINIIGINLVNIVYALVIRFSRINR